MPSPTAASAPSRGNRSTRTCESTVIRREQVHGARAARTSRVDTDCATGPRARAFAGDLERTGRAQVGRTQVASSSRQPLAREPERMRGTGRVESAEVVGRDGANSRLAKCQTAWEPASPSARGESGRAAACGASPSWGRSGEWTSARQLCAAKGKHASSQAGQHEWECASAALERARRRSGGRFGDAGEKAGEGAYVGG
ncbi:hypothetical protein B0H10DRAFT_1233 [Mycena sp. CBHHK59/15]|nr:hypothetical protein B0H10DRAFT_1233 [Mycena sp. CBHHK59/15]